MNEAFAKYHQSEEAAAKRHLWVCKSKHNNANTTRFVHTDKQLNHNISSTKVREIIAQNPIDIWGGKNVQKSSLARLEKKLEGIALSPKTLVRFIESKSKKKQGS